MKTFTCTALLLISSLAQASEGTHEFYCGLLDQEPAKQVLIEIADSDIESGLATVTLSEMGDRWMPFESAVQVRVELTWGTYRDTPAITGAEIDMGRTGRISMKATETYDEYGMAPGSITANVRNLNYPRGVDATYCTYAHSLGPKPGVTGSN